LSGSGPGDDRRAPGPGAGGYVEVRSPAGVWLARPGSTLPLTAGEADFLLTRKAERLPGREQGRGVVARFLLGGRPVVGKMLIHGGLFGPTLGRLYLGRQRAWSQAALADRLRTAGVATPRVVATGARRIAGPLFRLAVLTEEIREARNLLELARSFPGPPVRRRIADLTADTVRAMHDGGFLHADLNLANLVVEGGTAAAAVHIVDLDRGRFVARVRPADRVAGLARLLRSCEKWLASGTCPGARDRIRFLRRYARRDRRMVRRLHSGIARARRGWWARRRLWGPPPEPTTGAGSGSGLSG